MIVSTFSKRKKPRKIGKLRKAILGSTKAGLATRIGVAGSAVGGLALARRKIINSKNSSPSPTPPQNSNPIYKATKAASSQATQGAIEGGIEGAKISANKIIVSPIKQSYKKVRQRGYGPEARVRALGRKVGVAYTKARARGRKAEAKVMGVYGKLRAVGKEYEAKVQQQYRNVRAAGKKAERKVLKSRKNPRYFI